MRVVVLSDSAGASGVVDVSDVAVDVDVVVVLLVMLMYVVLFIAIFHVCDSTLLRLWS